MINKTATLPNKLPYLMAIFVIGELVLAGCFMSSSAKGPELTHYIVKVSPTVQAPHIETARLVLEESIFESVNHLVAQDPTLAYSEALDNVLPMSEVADNLPGGLVIVINNFGSATAYNIQIDVSLDAPLEKYRVFSGETFSVINEDKAKGILKISVDELPTREKIRIVVLLSEDYAVLLTALRTEDLQPPVLPTSQTRSMHDVEIMGTQTAVAIYNQNNQENLLQFQITYDIDNIQPTVLVSSGEMQSYFYETSMNEVEDKKLFFETFPQ